MSFKTDSKVIHAAIAKTNKKNRLAGTRARRLTAHGERPGCMAPAEFLIADLPFE
jgi:hypothetical protein